MSNPPNVEQFLALYQTQDPEGHGQLVTRLSHGYQCAALETVRVVGWSCLTFLA